MKNTTITLDELTLSRAREFARSQGYSFNKWVRKLIRDAIVPKPSKEMEELLTLADRSAGDSKGEAWSRDEIYER